MRVAFDTSFLNVLFNVNVGLKPYQGRVRRLVESLEKREGLIIIPMPAWAELLVGLRLRTSLQNYEDVKKAISESPLFEIMPFDLMSSDILVEVTYAALKENRIRIEAQGVKQKLKFDRQIIAVAKACEAEILYTADRDQTRFAKNEFGLEVKNLDSLR